MKSSDWILAASLILVLLFGYTAAIIVGARSTSTCMESQP